VGVKVEGGILDFVTRELQVECLPTDIPEKIVVDVSELGMNKHVRVSDIQAPARVTILTDPDVVIAHVVAPRAEEVAPTPEAAAAAPAEGAAAAEPEVIKKGKTAAEGEGEEKEAPKEKKEKK
jgi:large subunit ribosomal protein L25